MNYHLVVLVHGLWGSADHMEYLRTAILSNNPPTDSSAVVVLVANSFALYYTYDGVDVCGARVAAEVSDHIQRLEDTSPAHKVTRISVVGYSLGGLIARYAIGLLHSRGLFDSVRPESFTTFASPHVGVLALGHGPLARLYNAIAPYVLSYTSRQLCLVDNNDALHPGTPLLDVLADPARPFFAGLARFRKRAAYGNIVNDHRTEWYTTAFSTTDPYAQNVPNIAGPYVPGYAPVVIDTSHGLPLQVLLPLSPPPSPSTLFHSVLTFARRLPGRLGRWSVALVKVTVVVPVWFVAFIANAAFQTAVSAARKRQFLKSPLYAAFALRSPDDLSIPQKLHEEAGSALDSVMDAVKHEHGQTSGVSLRRTPTNNQLAHLAYLQQFTPACAPRPSPADAANPDTTLPTGSPVPELNLRPAHRRIIANLNRLSWEKFPVHIAGAMHTHAAIIVRYASPDFGDGKVVVDHWIQQVFVA